MKIQTAITPATGVLNDLPEDRRLFVQLTASVILGSFDGGDWPLAKEQWESAELDTDERIACFSLFDSKQSAYLRDANRVYLIDPRYTYEADGGAKPPDVGAAD